MKLSDSYKNLIKLVKKAAEDKLKDSPNGILCIRSHFGYTRYYCRKSKDEKTGTYLGHDCTQTIKALEEKEYLLKLKKTAEEIEQTISEIESKLNKLPNLEDVFYDIPFERRHLIQPLTADFNKITEQQLKIWKQTPKKKNDYAVNSSYVTQNGEKVRSKSELIIADRLKSAGIPYHYEYPKMLMIEELGQVVTWYPDFKVINQRTGQEYFWEHFGLMDNQEYRTASLNKLEVYAKNDIIQGKNLIITMECAAIPLSTENIDIIIREYLK